MTDSPSTEPNIEDRAANIRMTIDSIIQSGLDAMFERFDKLKKRGINDDDVVEALRYLGDIELLDDYAEWGDIDLREGGNTVLDETVPDPAGAPSYEPLKEAIANSGGVTYAKAEPPVTPGYTRFYPEGGGYLDIPDHLVEAFLKGGVE